MFTIFTKINSKWIRFLNVNCNTIRLLENNVVENLGDLGFGNDFPICNAKSTICERKS